MKSKEELTYEYKIELIKEVNNIILNQNGVYTEQDKIHLINNFMNDNPNTDIGIGKIPGCAGPTPNENENCPLLVAIKSKQLNIVDYLLTLKNAISDEMIKLCGPFMLGSQANPIQQILNLDLENSKNDIPHDKRISMIVSKMLDILEANPTYHAKKNFIDSAFLTFFAHKHDISEVVKYSVDKNHKFSEHLLIKAIYQHDQKIIDIFKNDQDMLNISFFTACQGDHDIAKILIEMGADISVVNKEGKNVLEVIVGMNTCEGGVILTQDHFDFYEYLFNKCKEKNIDHKETSENFFNGFYSRIKFDFDANPLEIIKRLIKMNPNFEKNFNVEGIDFKEEKIDAKSEYKLWKVLQKNQPEIFEMQYDASLTMFPFKEVKTPGLLNQKFNAKISKDNFDEFSSLKNLVIISMFKDSNGIPSKELFMLIKDVCLIPQEIVKIMSNYVSNGILCANDKILQLDIKNENTDVLTTGESSLKGIDYNQVDIY